MVVVVVVMIAAHQAISEVHLDGHCRYTLSRSLS
jgi:hypothetical protein